MWRINPTDVIVREHIIKGRAVVPFASCLNQCVESVKALTGDAPRELQQLLIRKPAIFESAESMAFEFQGVAESGMGRFEIREQQGARIREQLPWAEGVWKNKSVDIPAMPAAVPETVLGHDAFYQAASKAGFWYGPSLRRIQQIERSAEGWSGGLLDGDGNDGELVARTVSWDAMLQGGAVLAAEGGEECWLPFRIDRIRFGDDAAGGIDRFSGRWVMNGSGQPGKRVANISGWRDGSSAGRVDFLGVHFRMVKELSRVTQDAASMDAGSIGAGDILGRLRAAAPDMRRALLIRFIEDQLMEMLRWDSSARGDLDRGFVAIGLDSLMSVDLQFRLQTALDFALPIGEGFESISVPDLADALLERHLRLA